MDFLTLIISANYIKIFSKRTLHKKKLVTRKYIINETIGETMNTKLGQRPWFIGGVCGMASYIDSAAIVSNGTALVIYQQAFGLTGDDIGLLSGALTLFMALGALVGGRLGDMVGRKVVFTATMIMMIVGTFLLAISTGFTTLLMGTILVGLATGADLPVSLATISENASDENRGKLIGLSNVLWSVGIIAAIAFSSVVGDWGVIGGQILYFHVMIVAAITLLLRLLIPESPLWLEEKNNPQLAKASNNNGFNNFKKLLSGDLAWPFISLCIFYTLTNLAANTGGQFGTYIGVNVVGLSVSTNSLISLFIIPLGIVSGLFFMKIVDTSHRMKFFAFGAILLVMSYLTPVIFQFAPYAWFASILFMHIGNGFAFEGIMKVWAQESFPTMLRSTAQGAIVAFARFSCGVMAIYTPALINYGADVLYSLLAVMVFIGLLVGWMCFRNRRSSEFNNELVAS